MTGDEAPRVLATPSSADGRENLLDLDPDAALLRLRTWFAERGEPAYRATQVFARLWERPVERFEQMTEVPKALREALSTSFTMPTLALATRQSSSDGTEKFLFQLADGQLIETVAIPDDDRMTLCISSQAGCALQCAFCATGAMGFQRNLSPSEIAGQVRALRMLTPPILASNIVFMGMGEPMMNWKAVSPSLSLLNDPRALGIGARHITISTVGVLPGILALGERPEQFRLAISIHAPTDALRRSLMPVNIKYPLADVIAAAAAFDRRVTFEYVMLGGVNDQPEHAAQLAALARDCRAFVNLIPLHPGGSMGFVPSTGPVIAAFARALRARGVETAVRRSRGLDIAAACGQLRTERLGRRLPVAADEHREVDVA
ncbi:MAG: 23S rRNA (adenine(2503)-C(2))-methyltransferase RlmN [Gemmatimonadaceae bacterium]|jgi:23S rRNA (adenine2503-C2)-methyltransferase|nr:23S rRNA (adenine(2503)-C(2))-methyltransferase RlmN [Gemmatimonadaceae bacterium]MCC6431133.1 23S rRNA (adenine(2503)-C(2))-methyltransferase RlmN [Gemmatimonadaceae bacterium]